VHPAKRTTHRPLARPLLLLAALSAASLGLLVVAAALSDTSLRPLTDPFNWLASLDIAAANNILGNAAEVVAAVLAVAVTVVAIVVELAATRYSHEITRLFLQDPVNVGVLGLFVLTTVQCVWAGTVLEASVANALVPQAGFAITLALVTSSMLVLVPYIYYVFAFLSPISVIDRICRNAYRVILKAEGSNIPASQHQVQEAIDELEDVARSAIERADRGIAIAAVDALSNLLFDYVQVRDRLPEGWFDVTQSVATDSDFIALAPEAMAEVHSQGIWLERKILRRYNSLVGQSAGKVNARDVAYLIGIQTQRMITELGPVHPPYMELAQRSFNSYLRATINARDPRTAYYLLNLYRTAASALLRPGLERRVIEIAGYLCEYGQIAHKNGITFLLDSTANDLVQLIEDACAAESPVVDDLLAMLLELDQEIKEESHEESLLGVRRAQIRLATFFLRQQDNERAQRIIEDLRHERLERLERIRAQLLTDDRELFWELTDRGVSFYFLAHEQRPYLEPLFEALR
jgi:hypothetical protein